MKIIKGQEYGFSDVLYNGECSECGSNLPWEADFDADGTHYNAFCCNKHYSFKTISVKVDIEQFEENE